MRYCRAGYQIPHLKLQSELSLPMLSQCHGLWDEDDLTDSGTDKEESDDELSISHGRRASSDSLKSINLAASTESVHVSFPEQPTAVRRKRSGSSPQISHRSSFSSNRSQRGIHRVVALDWSNTLCCLMVLVLVGLGPGSLLGVTKETDLVM